MVAQKEFVEILNDLFDGFYIVDKDRRVVFWNPGAEEISGYRQAEVLGNRCSQNLLIHVDKNGNRLCDQGCPMLQTLQTGRRQMRTVYFKHKNGHRVETRVTVGPIRGEEGNVVQAYQIFDDGPAASELRDEVEILSRIALYDSLTELGNRRFAQERLDSLFNEFARVDRAFGLLFVDIDHFKAINDTYGHDAGDQVLKMVAASLAGNVRSYDAVCRWGGEEFVALIKCHDAAQLEKIGNKLRNLVAHSVLEVDGQNLSVTISLGGAMVREGDTPESLINRADELMYQAKQSGRNRVVVE